MREKALPPDLVRLLAEFDEAGGVLDIAVFEAPDTDQVSPENHQDAAAAAVQVAERKEREWLRRASPEAEPNIPYTMGRSKMQAMTPSKSGVLFP